MDSVRGDVVQVQVKKPDAWWTVLAIDPIAGPLVRLIAPLRWITPNRLTLLSIVLSAAAGACFASDALVLGALLYQLGFLADCLDGKLARVRGLSNPWGNFIDQIGDHGVFFVCLAGMIWGAFADADADRAWALALVAYACARFAILLLGEARPEQPSRSYVTVRPHPVEILKTAPARLTKPGTTVDTETLAFTVGPLIGQPLLGIAIAAAVDLLHVAVLVARGVLVAVRSAEPAPQRTAR